MSGFVVAILVCPLLQVPAPLVSICGDAPDSRPMFESAWECGAAVNRVEAIMRAHQWKPTKPGMLVPFCVYPLQDPPQDVPTVGAFKMDSCVIRGDIAAMDRDAEQNGLPIPKIGGSLGPFNSKKACEKAERAMEKTYSGLRYRETCVCVATE